MKIAVTGASGFIGRHVLAALAKHHNLSVAAAARSEQPPPFLPQNFNYVALDMDAANPSTYEQLGNPDVVIHLAWGGLPNYRSNRHFEEELPRQYRFIKALVDAGLPSLLISGTCYEYGMSSGCLSEEQVSEPANAYALAKITLHKQLLLLKAERSFGLTWARLFYSYGEGQAPSSLLPQLAAAVGRDDKRFAMSGGEQLRDYLPAETIGAQLAHLAIAHADLGAVNICSGEPISIRRFVEEQRALRGWDIEFDFGKYPYPDYEPMAFWGNAEKLRRLMECVRRTGS